MAGILYSRPNWVPPPPPPPRECSSSPFRVQGGRHSRLRWRGWGDPIPTKGQTLWYYMYTIIPLQGSISYRGRLHSPPPRVHSRESNLVRRRTQTLSTSSPPHALGTVNTHFAGTTYNLFLLHSSVSIKPHIDAKLLSTNVAVTCTIHPHTGPT
jgi:hypothetical protein